MHGPHLHLACQACGQVIGADLEIAEAFGQRFKAEYGFEAAFDHVSIPGLCQACATTRG